MKSKLVSAAWLVAGIAVSWFVLAALVQVFVYHN